VCVLCMPSASLPSNHSLSRPPSVVAGPSSSSSSPSKSARSPATDDTVPVNGYSKFEFDRSRRRSTAGITSATMGTGRGRITSIPATTTTTTTTTTRRPSSIHRTPVQAHGPTAPAKTRTEDTTFSLPIDIIDTPGLDELCLSPVGSPGGSRCPSPLSSTPVPFTRSYPL
jgi:hypothetical protein